MAREELIRLVKERAGELGVDLVNIDKFTYDELLYNFTEESEDNPDRLVLSDGGIKFMDKKEFQHFELRYYPEHPEILLDVSEEIRRDRLVLYDLLSRNVEYIDYIDDDFKTDRTFIERAIDRIIKENRAGVAKHMHKLIKGNEKFLKDREIVTKIAKKDYIICKYVDGSLLDEKFFMEVCKENPYAIRFASKEILNDDYIMSIPVSKEPMTLEFASEELRDNKMFAIFALYSCTYEAGAVLTMLSERLQDDKEIINLTLKMMGEGR